MIGKLTGRIERIDGTHLILDVQGVGYLVSVSAHTLRLAGEVGDTAALWIETQVREDAINLFGFAEVNEQGWFRLLTTVQGVGAKVALAILGILSPERLIGAIASGDKTALTAADGVGPKLGLRIVTELKDKVAHLALPASLGASKVAALPQGGVADDALSALLNLGYRRMEAFAAVSAAYEKLGADARIDALIRTALAELSNRQGTA
ncbi:MAG: Holliday junction branch migration protein RuvA [Bdellovibrionales bacterium]|jgi:Holliday junction DNA helicase RuvA